MILTIDFETYKAERYRPDYPPAPVGCSVKLDGAPSRYWSWGHPSGNNCTVEDFVAWVWPYWCDNNVMVLCHNAKFDLAVIVEKLGFPMPDWRRVHDTMFLAFLADPHSRSLGLKDLAEKLCGMAPDEQEELNEWLWNHRFQIRETTGDKFASRTQCGAYIAYAPGELVGRYAMGDTDRTFEVFTKLYPLVQRYGMGRAYDVERELLPILMDNERLGIRVDMQSLEHDVSVYRTGLHAAEEWLRRRLNASGLNLDADQDVGEAFARTGVVRDEDFVRTKTGQRSLSKDNLKPSMFQCVDTMQVFYYRNRLVTALNTFMAPWYEQASLRKGVISTTWHQTRGGEAGGTRTGRPSTSNPNFLNIPKDLYDEKVGPPPTALGLPSLPHVRQYLLPDEGHWWIYRDFDGQELRVFAHFEQGALHAAYRQNPNLDPHSWVQSQIAETTGQHLERKPVKMLNFQALYGGGVPAAQRSLDCSYAEAKAFKAYHDQALPGRKMLANIIKGIAKRGKPICTWGGRLYFVEPPRVINGERREFDYKLINYLVQGSAADITKRVILNWYKHPERKSRFLMQVYDEISISAPEWRVDEEDRILMECMEDVELDVPMKSSGGYGYSWYEATQNE